MSDRDPAKVVTIADLPPAHRSLVDPAYAVGEPPSDEPEPVDGDSAEESCRTLEDAVFTSSTILATIQQAAHCRLVVPWAVLGVTLARIIAEVPPHFRLPPVIGSDASLNLAVAIVAASGGGKTGAAACSRDVLRILDRRAQSIGPGSGEAIAAAFLEWDPDTKQNRLIADPQALLSADEIAQIGVIQGRASQASFGPIIRSMLSGGPVANSAVDKDRRRHLEQHSYRLCVTAGVQPRLSDVLLSDQDAGTPQRWLWLPADDPHWSAPPTLEPPPIEWRLPPPPYYADRIHLTIPDEAAEAIRAARVRGIRREGDPLDGHRLLLQEKVAAALAILHGTYVVTSQWWEVAGLIMRRSDATRDYCQRELTAKLEQGHRVRGQLDAVRDTAARAARDEAAIRQARAIWRVVFTGQHANAKHQSGEGCTSRCIAHALRHHKGADRQAAIAAAVDLDWIVSVDGRYFAGSSRPSDEVAA